MLRVLSTVTTLALMLALGSCEAGPTDLPDPPAVEEMRVSRAVGLTPGSTAQLHGTRLGEVTSLTLDGLSVPFRVVNDTTLAIDVPVLRSCETDGRPVDIVANGSASATARLEVRDTVVMEPGERRRLTVAELDGSCVRFGANGQGFALVLMNTALSGNAAAQTHLTYEVWTGDDAEPAAIPQSSMAPLASRAGDLMPHEPAGHTVGAMSFRSAAADPFAGGEPFDPAYLTARVGDTIRLPSDYFRYRDDKRCTAPRGTVASYPAQVLAVEGSTVIAVDLEDPNAAAWLQKQDEAARVAGTVEQVLLPTMREVFDPEYEHPGAAGGRHFHILTTRYVVGKSVAGYFPATFGSLPPAECPNSTGAIFTLLSATSPLSASTIVHEHAHGAHWATEARAGRAYGDRIAGGFLSEAFAVNATETAARILTEQNLGARPAESGESLSVSDVPWIWGRSREASAYTGPGWYRSGSALLLYARDRSGETDIGAADPPVLQRMLAARDLPPVDGLHPGLQSLAAAVGMSADDFLHDALWAIGTDDLWGADGRGAEAFGIPHLTTWAHHDARSAMIAGDGPRGTENEIVSRSSNVIRSMGAAPGTVDLEPIFAERNPDGSDLGVSLEVAMVTLSPHLELWLVRLY